MRDAAAWKVVVVAAAVAALLAAFATCGRDETPMHVEADARAPAIRSAAKRRVRASTPAAQPSSTDPSPTTASAEETDDVPLDDGFPFLDVEVVGPDGAPVADALVYALPAGAPGRDFYGPPAAGAEGGRCLLHLPRPGRYDVGAETDGIHALVEDVEAPRAASLRIELPPPAPIVVRIDDAFAEARERWTNADTWWKLDSAPGAKLRPGRGEHCAGAVLAVFDAVSRVWRARAETGGRYSTQDFDPRFRIVADPASVVAPGEIVLRRGETDAPDAVVRPVEPAPEAAPDAQASAWVHASAVGGDSADAPALVRFHGHGHGASTHVDKPPGEAAQFRLGGGEWVWPVRGEWTAQPRRYDPHAERVDAAFSLVRGGFLAVALERRPPADLGRVWIARKDEAPFLTKDADGLPTMAADVLDVLVVGPLPPGPIDFVYGLGDETFGEVRAEVVPGGTTTLVVPPLSRVAK